MSPAVGTDFFDIASPFDGSVDADDIVIAYPVHSPLAMPLVDVIGGEVQSAACGGTVDDNSVDGSHFVF